MLRIMEKEIDVINSEVLLDEHFTQESFEQNWQAASGDWWLENGWLTGRFRENGGGMLYSKSNFPGNIMLDFEGRTVPPCANDLNFVWNTEGWNAEKKDAGIGYIAGLSGWWEGKVGFEHYPECKFRAGTPLFSFEAGRTYHIQAGSIDGHCFIFVDGKLIIEGIDPDPIDSSIYSKVGLGTYCSYIQIRNFKVRKICWKPCTLTYTAEF
jgi:hypothetical protein